MKYRLLFAAVTAALSAHSLDAKAQAWLADRRYAEGMGIRTGNLELHPGIGGEVGYDSNYFQRSEDDAQDIASAIRIRITPSLSLSTLKQERIGEAGGGPPPSVTFRLGAAASYNELIATSSDQSDEVSDQRHVAGNVSGQLAILPERTWGADLNAGYNRTVEPSNDPDTSQAFDRSSITAGAMLRWRPGGGLFQWRAGYNLRATLFEDAPFEGFNNLQHNIDTDGRWKFLPRTALLYRARLTLLRYSDDDTSQNEGELVRSLVGVNGLVTKHLGLLGMIGWGATFLDGRPGFPPENFDSVIGQAEATWYILPDPTTDPGGATTGLSSVSLGYTRDFQNSYFGDYYQSDRVYANFSYFAGGVFIVTLGGGYSHITRPNIYFPGTTPTPDDDAEDCGGITCIPSYGENRVDASLFAEYRVADGVGVNSTIRYNANLTDITAPDGGTGDHLDFSRWQAYLGLRWFL